MAEPAVGRGTVPVLGAGRDVDHVARLHFDGVLALFLIVSAACDADEDLPAALLGMMDVPVVAAARLKGHVEDADL